VVNACAVLNKYLGFKYKMLITFYVIWHVLAELFTPAWQRDVRDITYQVIEAMEEAKKEEPVAEQPERED